MFYDDLHGLLRTAVIGLSAYVVLVVFLRISGRRTLSKMNAFDFVVTISLGSVLATLLLSKNVTLANGALAFALLIFLQFTVTWFSVRVPLVKKIVTGKPVMLLHEGEVLREALLKARVTDNEIRAAVRSSGIPSIKAVKAVILETDGSFSVVPYAKETDYSALEGVVHLGDN